MFILSAHAQDGLNQVIIVNSGQFGNPAERSTLAYFNPTTMSYVVIDTLPSNSIQDVIIEDDYAYIAAQNVILKYDLDNYELMASVDFPGLSAHQLEIYEDQLLATNYFGQVMNNIYVFDKSDLTVVDTVQEITHPGGTMAVFGDDLYVSQNFKGSIDACPPFGCFNDTLGYLARIDLTTNQWIENITLDNNGNECGRIVKYNNTIVALNEVSNTVTVYLPSTGVNVTEAVAADITTMRYRTEAETTPGALVSLFDGGVGVLAENVLTADVFIDTPATAFAYDLVNDHFYVVDTDFFSYNNGYAFNSAGDHLFDFPVGINPEAVAVHYNHQPVGLDFETNSRDTIIIDVNDFATDPDDDDIVAIRVENAPINGVLTILEDGSVRYVSLSPGSADAFRIEVCDEKLNPLCSFIDVTILSTTAVASTVFNDVSVYPNPVEKQLQIRHPVEGSRYELFNSVGEVQAKFDEANYDVSELSPGIYYLKISKEGVQKVFPVIKL